MPRNDDVDVLVVGAGPVGLLTALRLAEHGLRPRIIDEALRPAAHSYACALHPATMRLLDRAGVAAALLRLGRRVETIAFYDGDQRRAKLELATVGGEFPFVLVVPQSSVENLLEQQLQRKAGVAVEWNHRLWDLSDEGATALATVDRLGESAKGYIVPEWDWIVKKRMAQHARWVVGADGQRSLVRQCLGIETERLGLPQSYAVFEFEVEEAGEDEIGVVLDSAATSVLWPLPGRRRKWSFELTHAELNGDFPAKERSELVVFEPEADEDMRGKLALFAGERAPWFADPVVEIDWSAEVQFQSRLAREFGRGRSWLAGDAAHQTGPVGVQSMNVGMREAVELADLVAQALHNRSAAGVMENYNQPRRQEWQQLLGVRGGLRARGAVDPWVAAHAERLLPCLPASGADLEKLLAQLGLEFT